MELGKVRLRLQLQLQYNRTIFTSSLLPKYPLPRASLLLDSAATSLIMAMFRSRIAVSADGMSMLRSNNCKRSF